MALLFVEKRSIGEHNGGKFSVLLLLFRPRSLEAPVMIDPSQSEFPFSRRHALTRGRISAPF